MINTLQYSQAAGIPAAKDFKPKDVVSYLSKLAEKRAEMINLYPYQKGADRKLQCIDKIRQALLSTEDMQNDRQIILTCLMQEVHFHLIAPINTIKLSQQYMNKLNPMMEACRLFLGWRKQE